MKDFAIDCELSYEGFGASTYVFNIAAQEDERQHIRHEQLSLLPKLPYREFKDAFGNRFLRINTQGGPLSVRSLAEVEVREPRARPVQAPDGHPPVTPARLPPETLIYLLPS